jgi:hypothetical protein
MNGEQPNGSTPQLPTLPLSEQTFLEQHGIPPVLFAYISLVVVFILYQFIGGLIAALFIIGDGVGGRNVGGLRIATVAAQIIFVFGPTLVLARMADLKPQAFLRVGRPKVSTILLPFFAVFSLQQMFQVYMTLQEKVPLPQAIESKMESLKRMIEETYKMMVGSSTIPELLAVVVVVAVVPAIAEEFFFRGLVQRSLERGLGALRGIVIAAVIFGLYHLNPFSLIPLIGLGLYFGFLVYRSNNIWVSVAAHFYNNLLACIAVYLQLDENFLVTGDPGTLSPVDLAATFAAFSLVFVISTYYFIVVTKPITPTLHS